MSGVKETAEYDNYLDKDARKNDKYKLTLDEFFDSETETKVDVKKKEIKSNCWKSMYVNFRNLDDVVEFCEKVNMLITDKTRDVFFPLANPKTNLFGDVEETKLVIDRTKMVNSKFEKKESSTLGEQVNNSEIKNRDDIIWRNQWNDMPRYVQEHKPTYRKIVFKFRVEKHYHDFMKLIGNSSYSTKTKSIWYPALNTTANRKLRWIQEDGINILPKYPVYIVSKGRSDTMITSKSLARMKVPHYIVIEPQDEIDYENALDNFNIRDMVTLLVAPFSNHGDGPGRARNWAWDHSMSIGASSHWVLDDNISDFYRITDNIRIRFESGVGFKVMEDFVDRYDNIYISGPQYRFFIAPDQKYPAFVRNTRIYSCLLIRNDCKHRWRGRYNEDTDICLRVLKDGDCTVQFNAFLQGKMANQTLAGGNTAEFYHVEGDLDKEKWRGGGMNAEGTINKSKMLVDMHPDVAELVWKYGRWHHYVDYSSFKKNKLILKDGVNVPKETNEYGMKLIKDFTE